MSPMQTPLGPAADSSGGRDVRELAIEMSRIGLRLFGCGAPMAGTIPDAASAEPLVQAGTVSVQLDGTGAVTVPFPKPFPRAIVALSVLGNYNLVWVGAGLVSFTLFKGPANATVMFTYIAIGY